MKNTVAKEQQRSVVTYASDVKEKRRALIFFFFFKFGREACGILVPQLRIQPGTLAVTGSAES